MRSQRKGPKPLKVAQYVYETGKRDPVAAILENGVCIDLDPWDVEQLYKLPVFEKEKG